MSFEEIKPTGDLSAGKDNAEKEHPVEQTPLDQPSATQVAVENINSEGSQRLASHKPLSESLNFDRVVDEAREQMSKAADAFSRGDFIQNAAPDPSATSDDKLVAALCYFVPGLMALLVLFSESGGKRAFQRYHAVQSLGLSVALVAISLAYTVISAVVWAVPVVGWLVGLVLFCLAPIAFLMAMIAFLYYGYQAYLGKRFAIPGLTGYLRDQGWL